MANYGISSLDATNTIIVDGKTFTQKEYRAYIKEKQKASGKCVVKRVAKKQTEISELASEVERMLAPLSTLKSVQVYKNHAYRSWGTIANEILSYKGIRVPMTSYCVKFRELNELVEQLKEMAKKNEKAAYQFIEKIAWKLDDMKTNIKEMQDAVDESGVCFKFRNHEAINGKGRQLGLGTIMKKCYKTIAQVEEIVKTLTEIVDKGTDPFLYGTHMSPKTRSRCWA